MLLAAPSSVAKFTGRAPYVTGKFHDEAAAAVNRAVVERSGGKLPCYAIPGKRVPFKWVSVGSSCGISRGVAADMLARVGVNIDSVEMA